MFDAPSSKWTSAFIAIIVLGLFAYLRALHRRLSEPHPLARAAKRLPDHVLLQTSAYKEIDNLQDVGPPLQLGVAVVGGSGSLGQCMVRLLLLRGESRPALRGSLYITIDDRWAEHIRIIDLKPPSKDLLASEAVEFESVDIRDQKAVAEALQRPLVSLGQPPRIVHLTAVVIRFWERSPWTRSLTYDVNVLGVQHVIDALADLCKDGVPRVLVYTASAACTLPSPKFMRLGDGSGKGARKTAVRHDDDPELTSGEWPSYHYAVSKILAERLVRDANGRNGLRTGCIRAGM